MPDLPPPVLEVFYSPSCAPCRLELPVLANVAGQDGVRVRIVILDQEERSRDELRAVSADLEAASTSPAGVPGDVLRAAGDANGILPYARSLAPNGEVCGKWSGGLTLSRAQDLLAACARFITSPRRPRS
jgi:thiol-disulfide isomerase/thioredoxin